MDISVDEKDIAPVAGMKSHPANFGRLCVKGSALHDTLDQTDRLLHPTMNGQAADWDTALNLVADKIRQVVSTHVRKRLRSTGQASFSQKISTSPTS